MQQSARTVPAVVPDVRPFRTQAPAPKPESRVLTLTHRVVLVPEKLLDPAL